MFLSVFVFVSTSGRTKQSKHEDGDGGYCNCLQFCPHYITQSMQSSNASSPLMYAPASGNGTGTVWELYLISGLGQLCTLWVGTIQ